MSIYLYGGKIVGEESVRAGNILIRDEKIAEILPSDEPIPRGVNDAFDVSGKLIMPGVIDAHTHYALASRGTETREDFLSGSRAASCGGVTLFIDFSPHLEEKPLPVSARSRIEKADKQSVIDFHLHQTVHNYSSSIEEQLSEIRSMGISSIKVFTTYKEAGYMVEVGDRKPLLEACRRAKLLPTVHAEDDKFIREAREKMIQEKGGVDELSMQDHPDLRPAGAEAKAIKKLGRIAAELEMPLYFDHVSSSAGLKEVEKLRQRGAIIAAETAPHYLFLDRSCFKGSDAEKYFMVPPLRERVDCLSLKKALVNGKIDVVATDHCAYAREQKARQMHPLKMLPGIPGSETLLSLMHELMVNRRDLSYTQLSQVLSKNPARFFGLYPERGKIAVSSAADIVVFDPDLERELKQENLHSRAGYSPYDHLTVRGYPVMTIARGEVVMKDGNPEASGGRGRFVRAGASCLF